MSRNSSERTNARCSGVRQTEVVCLRWSFRSARSAAGAGRGPLRRGVCSILSFQSQLYQAILNVYLSAAEGCEVGADALAVGEELPEQIDFGIAESIA